jgi:hypothetical protein
VNDEEFFASKDEVMNGPFDPKVPCRHMETRSCVVVDPAPEQLTGYRAKPCPPGECGRFANRDRKGL